MSAEVCLNLRRIWRFVSPDYVRSVPFVNVKSNLEKMNSVAESAPMPVPFFRRVLCNLPFRASIFILRL